MRKRKFKIPIYHGCLHVIYSKNIDKLVKKYNLNEEAEKADAFVFKHPDKELHYYAIFRVKDIDTIAHEAVHIVNHIFDDRCISLDLKNDEPQAYLTGWAVRKILKTLKPKKYHS